MVGRAGQRGLPVLSQAPCDPRDAATDYRPAAVPTRREDDLALSAASGERRYFGTDGVRGVVGHDLTLELVERLGRAFGAWKRGGEVLVGRDTRGSGPELEAALVAGLAEGGTHVTVGGVLPTPAVALLGSEHGAVISASHNPPEYNGVKFFVDGGRKLTDEEEESIEALLDAPSNGVGVARHEDGLAERYIELVLERFGGDLSGLRLAVDCANGAYAGIAPEAFRRLGADVVAIGDEPSGDNINVGCGATDLSALQQTVTSGRFDLGVAFDGDGDRMLAVDAAGNPVHGHQILAILALELGVELVAVTVITNLGLHRLMAERGIRVVTTPVGDRYVLDALPGGRRPRRRAVRSPHLPARARHGGRARRGAAALRRPPRTPARRSGRRDAALCAGQREHLGSNA